MKIHTLPRQHRHQGNIRTRILPMLLSSSQATYDVGVDPPFRRQLALAFPMQCAQARFPNPCQVLFCSSECVGVRAGRACIARSERFLLVIRNNVVPPPDDFHGEIQARIVPRRRTIATKQHGCKVATRRLLRLRQFLALALSLACWTASSCPTATCLALAT